MSGDVSKAALWADADVYIDFVGTATDPEDTWTDWDAAWGLAGLISTDGITQARSESSSDHYAMGGILVRSSYSQHKRTFKFVALESNPTTFRLVNPGSTAGTADGDGLVTNLIKVPKRETFRIGMELREGSTVRRRIIESAEMQEVGDISETEDDLEQKEVTLVVYPDADGLLFTEIEGPAVDPGP